MKKEICNIRQPHPGYYGCDCHIDDLIEEYEELKKSKLRFLNMRYYWLKFRLK